MHVTTQIDPFTQVPPQIVQHWGLFLVFGLSFMGLAVIAWIRSTRATINSVYFFGWLLVLASIIEAVDAHMTGGWTGFYLHLVGAILFGVAGCMLLMLASTNVEKASLILAMYFTVAGIFNIVAPLLASLPARGWHLWAGFITLLLGPLVLGIERFKMKPFRVIGIFIGTDLFFRGLALAVFALDLRTY
jgi:uncharacterized membrane protein HdeD (DUF308 family)